MKKSITILLVLFSILANFIFLWADYPPHFVYTKCPVIYKNDISMLYSYNEALLTKNISIIQYIINERDDIKKRISYYRNDLQPCTLKTWSSPRYSRIKIDGISYDGDITDSVEISNGVWLYPYSYCEDPILKQEYFNYAYASHTGNVIASIIHFVFTIDSLDKWDTVNPYFTRDSLITLCEESFAEYNNVFYEEGETGRWLWFQDDLSGTMYADIFYPQYPYDHYNFMIPNNMIMSSARGALYLYAATGKEEYLDKMTGAFKHFQSNLFLDFEKDCYYWSYPDDYVEDGGDDISHGGFSVNTITEAYKLIGDNVFDSIDMNRFTNTLLKTIVADTLVDTIHNGFFFYKFVDGYHDPNPYIKTDNYTFAKAVMYRYLELSIINPLVYEVIHNLNPSCTDLRYFKHLYNPLDVSHTFVYPYPGEMAIDISIKSLVNYNLKQDTVIIRIYDPSDINLYYYEEKYILSEGDSIYGELFPEPPKETNTLIIEAIMLRKDIIEVLAEADTIAVPKVLEVDCPEDVPVLTYFNYEVFVYEEEIIYPLTNAHVILTNSMSDPSDFGYIYEEGYTGTDGKVSFNIYAENTKDLAVIVDKDGYRETVKESDPYMWSYTPDAFGKNNQNSILRKTNTDSMYIVYSDGDSIVYGCSDDFGKYWYLEKIGRGINPTIVKTETGLIAMWNYSTNIEYSILSSPWTPIDTVSLPVCWSSEPTLTGAKSSQYKYGAYIGYRHLPSHKGDLIFGKWLDDALVNLELDTVFDGSVEGIIPMASPLVSPYMKDIVESYLVGCISTDWELIAKLWDPTFPEWSNHQRVSEAGQKAMNPSVDYANQTTTFVWEVDNLDGSTDIWRAGSIEYGKISCTDGINTYPISRDEVQTSYLNNYIKIIGFRDGYSDPYFPRTYEIYEGIDSIQCMDVNAKKYLFHGQLNTKMLYGWFEGNNNDYRLKTKVKVYDNLIQPYFVTEPTDTNLKVINSPIYDYVNGSFPVERLSYTATALDNEMQYIFKVTTDDKNPAIPEVIMIDGEVAAVVYGSNNEQITEIIVPKEMYADNETTISIDRKKDNPNRQAYIELYEYETGGEETEIASLNKIAFNQPPAISHQPSVKLSIDYQSSTIDLFYSIPKDIHIKINIFDITGRVVEQVYNGMQTKGQYSYALKNKRAGVYFAVMEAEGQTYKAKIINIR